MPYVNHPNPWAEAAAMGAETADKLGQIMYQMPMQRAQLAAQLQQAKAQQQQEMLNYALKQQAQKMEADQFAQTLDMNKQKFTADEQRNQLMLARMQKQVEEQEQKNKLLSKGSFKVHYNKDTGKGFFYNDRTGETKPLPSDYLSESGLGSSQNGSQVIPPSVQSAQMRALGGMFEQFNRSQQYGMAHPEVQNPTNAAYPQFSQATNMVARLAPLLLGGLQQPQGIQPTNNVPVVPSMNNAPAGMPLMSGPTNQVPAAIPYDQFLKSF